VNFAPAHGAREMHYSNLCLFYALLPFHGKIPVQEFEVEQGQQLLALAAPAP